MKTLGIIGTAGRGEDGTKMNLETWRRMLHFTRLKIANNQINCLVSGGSSWADHVAVALYLECKGSLNLKLFLPVGFKDKFNEEEITIPFNCGNILNHFHKQFSKVIGMDTFEQIRSVLDSGVECSSGKGFHGRNTQIANNSTDLLAFTFGDGPNLKDGGTKDTWDKFMKREDRGVGYHYNLTENKMYEFVEPEKVESFW